MKKNYTDIILLLDKSGSMMNTSDDTIGGYNQFISDQKELDGEAKFTLVLFNNRYSIEHNGIDVQEVPELTSDTYRVGGTTALYSAIDRTINEAGDRFKQMDESDRPENVIFVIFTDGKENASPTEMTSQHISDMITHQTEKYNWEFVFLGANQDAFKESGKLGIPIGSTMTYNPRCTDGAFGSMSRGLSETRCNTRYKGQDYFNDDDRKAQE